MYVPKPLDLSYMKSLGTDSDPDSSIPTLISSILTLILVRLGPTLTWVAEHITLPHSGKHSFQALRQTRKFIICSCWGIAICIQTPQHWGMQDKVHVCDMIVISTTTTHSTIALVPVPITTHSTLDWLHSN